VSDLADLLDDAAAELLDRYWGSALTRQGRLDEARPYITRLRATLESSIWLEEPHWLGAAVVEFDHAGGRKDPTAIVDDLLSRPMWREGAAALVMAGVTALADQFGDVVGTSRDRRQVDPTAVADRWIERIDRVDDDGPRLSLETRLFVEAAVAQRTRLGGCADPERWARLASSFQRIGFRYDEALARFHHGEALLAGVAGRGLAARRAAERALTLSRAIATDLAASPLVLRIDELAHRARLQLDTALSKSGEQAADPWRVDYALTPRERDVLALLARGRSNGEIGRELFISTKTASVHVSSILRKLGVSNRVEAAAIAVQRSPG
jgi:DNA-binding CsgD family transcriptional regulator